MNLHKSSVEEVSFLVLLDFPWLKMSETHTHDSLSWLKRPNYNFALDDDDEKEEEQDDVQGVQF